MGSVREPLYGHRQRIDTMAEPYLGWHEFHPDLSLESITSSIVGRHLTATDRKAVIQSARNMQWRAYQ